MTTDAQKDEAAAIITQMLDAYDDGDETIWLPKMSPEVGAAMAETLFAFLSFLEGGDPAAARTLWQRYLLSRELAREGFAG